jgi:hypothetical protein
VTASVEPHAELRSPTEEGVRAIEHTRQLLQNALAALDKYSGAEGDDEQLSAAYELAAECADHIGRALWFLRRMAREGEALGS